MIEHMTTLRRSIGLKRPNPVQVNFNDEELEFIARHVYDIGSTSSTYGRERMLPRHWKKRLEQLRKLQNYKPLYELDGRRKNI